MGLNAVTRAELTRLLSFISSRAHRAYEPKLSKATGEFTLHWCPDIRGLYGEDSGGDLTQVQKYPESWTMGSGALEMEPKAHLGSLSVP